ncbi:hypothetical protein CMQ_7276 [Grosmannia clavigera kw1407]|uniref:DUF7053 domain-containing protein n=1 Tax=Grosmannia clavigera (strain kw1407 / UAMH 11150) TaxID=655863 RepID=F0XPF8_GROCL|nr:uncharacterized protein CMQ_7276 [Grosmannia clavigera kw1407]EFX00274.1 hypothetical protein CMQ_7276 [Grosmannia clavigera kw1407]
MPTLTFHLAIPLPAALSPGQVIQAMHRYEPLITPNPFLVSYRRRPVDLREIVDDAFFRDDGQALAAFEVVDRIVLVPGLATKQVVIPCVMQRFDDGLRCRSFAAGGVRVWSTWRVQPAVTGAEALDNDVDGSPLPSAVAYELVEEARVECSVLVKPFVGRSFQAAHMDILRSVVREIMQQQA